MRVFISWSGPLSRQIGEAFRNWIPSSLQFVKPYFSPSDIDKGSRWANEVSKELSSSGVCIIIVTQENINSRWIMFEAGAVSTSIESSRVCPILFQLEPTDITQPLAQFQITKFDKSDIKKLFVTINSASGDSHLSDAVLDAVFDKWWPDLEARVSEIITNYRPAEKNFRSDRDILEELLLTTRGFAQSRNQNRIPLPYHETLYRDFVNTLTNLWFNADLNFDEAREFKSDLKKISDHASIRMSGELRTGIIKDIDKLTEAVDNFISDDNDDDIPF